MSHGSFLGCRMAPAGLLALAIVFGTFPDLTAQVGREGGGSPVRNRGTARPCRHCGDQPGRPGRCHVERDRGITANDGNCMINKSSVPCRRSGRDFFMRSLE